MKKNFTKLLFVLIFLFFTIVNTDSYAITDNIKLKESVDSSILKINNIAKETEKEIMEAEQKEIDTGNSNYVQESSTDDYIQEENSTTETNYENYGTYGRLYISWFNVALYDFNVNTDSSISLQEIDDNYDSAAYYITKGRLVIADHNTQGFSVLYDLPEGTTSYIKFADGSIIQYRLIKKANGYNTGPDLVDTEGNSFFDMDSNIIMYTCSDGGIMVTLWNIA